MKKKIICRLRRFATRRAQRSGTLWHIGPRFRGRKKLNWRLVLCTTIIEGAQTYASVLDTHCLSVGKRVESFALRPDSIPLSRPTSRHFKLDWVLTAVRYAQDTSKDVSRKLQSSSSRLRKSAPHPVQGTAIFKLAVLIDGCVNTSTFQLGVSNMKFTAILQYKHLEFNHINIIQTKPWQNVHCKIADDIFSRYSTTCYDIHYCNCATMMFTTGTLTSSDVHDWNTHFNIWTTHNFLQSLLLCEIRLWGRILCVCILFLLLDQ